MDVVAAIAQVAVDAETVVKRLHSTQFARGGVVFERALAGYRVAVGPLTARELLAATSK